MAYEFDGGFEPMKKRKPPEHTILISFSIFCTKCGKEMRAATTDDRMGDHEYCDDCDQSVRTAVGIAVNANTTEEIQYSMQEMQKNIPLIHKVLSEWSTKK